MKNISDKLKVLSVALNERGLDSYASEVEELYNEVDDPSDLAGAAAVGVGGAVAGSVAIELASASVAGALAGMGGLTFGTAIGAIGTGIAGIFSWPFWVGAAIIGTVAYPFIDWWGNSTGLIDRLGGTKDDSIETLYQKWKDYFRDFDLINGRGSFPETTTDNNVGGKQDRNVDQFFGEFDVLFENGQKVTESQLENWVEQYSGEDLLDWNTWGLDDEMYFVNAFNLLIDGKKSLEESLILAREEAERQEVEALDEALEGTLEEPLEEAVETDMDEEDYDH